MAREKGLGGFKEHHLRDDGLHCLTGTPPSTTRFWASPRVDDGTDYRRYGYGFPWKMKLCLPTTQSEQLLGSVCRDTVSFQEV
ncbi:uncharacterized protein G6M90_00g098640 [Metarhizium brunneum]|uniref:Uncharacterized protein n=1 Tax=Metarhizium brunneum TaxID=500148 RepID=A0A7D5YXH4_9HYPO|nr:hypothetical protein G6M90_00g098640 [Metarhizium brunneum]